MIISVWLTQCVECVFTLYAVFMYMSNDAYWDDAASRGDMYRFVMCLLV